MSDNMSVKKKRRSKNFTYVEKCAFVNILTKYWEILENKKFDSITLRGKEAAWSKLVDEFNAFPQVEKRNSKQLKFFYDNFKCRTRKKCRREKLERFQTGFQTITSNDESSNKMMNLLKNKNHLKNSSSQRLPSSSLLHEDDASISAPQENEPTVNDAIQEETLHSSVIPASLTSTPAVLLEKIQPLVVKTEQTEPDEQEIPTVPLEADPSPVLLNRNQSSVQRRESPSSITMKKIAVLADNRNKIIEMELKVLESTISKDSELRELKMKVQREKLRAYEAKRLYYETKLASCNCNGNSQS